MAAVRTATPFIGRAPQLGRLRELLSGAVAGTSAAALLAGDAGVGKTSLAAEFGRHARAAGALVLTGRNVDLGSGGLPYLPLSEALAQVLREGRPPGGPGEGGGSGPGGAGQGGGAAGDGTSAHGSLDDDATQRARAARDVVLRIAGMRPALARLAGRGDPLPAERGPGDADLDRLALFEAVAETLSRIATTVAPVVLVIEDLHWAEQSTRDLLRFLLSRLGSDPLLIVATYRADDLHRRHPVRALLAELVRLPSVELIELKPFDSAELSDFLASIQGERLPPDVVRRIGDRSAGNAYFAEELLSAGPEENRLPSALADVLLDRLERLAPGTQQLMRVASVIGTFRIEESLLRDAVSGGTTLTAADADEAVRDAVAHQVLVPDETDRFGFRHALLQEAVYADLLPGERVRLHAVVAGLLARRDPEAGDDPGSDAAEQARHSLAAHDLPQALAASLLAAAAATRRLAPAEALSQYEQALQLWPVVDAERRPAGADLVSIEIDAADAAGHAGLGERAVALTQAAVEAALAAGDRPEITRARSRLAMHLYTLERMDEVLAAGRSVIADHPGTANGGVADEPTPALVWARAILARALYSLYDTDGAAEVLRAGLSEARTLGLRAAEADMEMTQATLDGTLGRPEADQHLAAAREAAAASGDQSIVIRVAYGAVIDRFEEGDLDGVLGMIDEALQIADRAGLSNGVWATQCRWMLVNAHWMRGDPQSALDVVAAGVRQLPPLGSRQLRNGALPMLASRTPALALQEAEKLDRVYPNPWDAPVRWAAKAEAHAWLGDLDRSVHCSGSAIDVLEELGEPWLLMGISISTSAIGVLADLAARARAAGDTDGAARVLTAADRFIRDAGGRARNGRPRRFRMGPEGLAWLARLDAEQARLTGSDTAELWQAAVDAFGFGAVYEQSRCRWRLAQRLLQDGDRDTARTQLNQARVAASNLGAQPLLAALDDLAKRGRLDSSAPVAASGTRLTARERDVMRLVAQGLTNRAIGERLFISEKTASVHVSNVLTKLDASGRTEAVAIATRDGLLDD